LAASNEHLRVLEFVKKTHQGTAFQLPMVIGGH